MHTPARIHLIQACCACGGGDRTANSTECTDRAYAWKDYYNTGGCGYSDGKLALCPFTHTHTHTPTHSFGRTCAYTRSFSDTLIVFTLTGVLCVRGWRTHREWYPVHRQGVRVERLLQYRRLRILVREMWRGRIPPDKLPELQHDVLLLHEPVPGVLRVWRRGERKDK